MSFHHHVSVGPYYPEGFNPVKIIVSDQYCRATPGGVGHAKTAGNYAASIYAEREAAQSGYTQVLWLDAIERKVCRRSRLNEHFLCHQ